MRQRIYRGVMQVAGRQIAGTFINLIGVIMLTRALGPGSYGLYAASVALVVVAQLATQLGVHTYLVRWNGLPGRAVYEAMNGHVLALAVLGAVLGMLLASTIEGWTRLDGLAAPLAAMLMALPVTNGAQVPLAIIERELEYGRIALAEVVAQALFFVVSVPLAFAGFGVWAPVLGWWVQQSVQAVAYHRAARYWPRLRWDGALFGSWIRFGFSYATSLWVWQLRRLANPFFVGRYLGAEAVALVAISTQIATHLGVIATASWRVATAALAHVQNDFGRLRAAITEGMPLQVLSAGPAYVVFAVVAPYVAPALFGEDWARLATVFPFIAAAALGIATFNIHCSALYVLGRNWTLTLYHLLHVAVLALTCVLLVPRMGLTGYGIAELASMASFAALHVLTRRVIGAPRYGRAALAFAALSLALLLAAIHAQFAAVALTATVVAVLTPWQQLRPMLTGIATAE